MSLHPVKTPTPAEVLAASSREIPKSVKTALLASFAIGALIFIVGLFVDPARAWSAFHANWLFFTAMSAGGVTFVAVQRITTARWSRAVIRFMEGYVAFLPVAFVFLAVTFIGRTPLRVPVGTRGRAESREGDVLQPRLRDHARPRDPRDLQRARALVHLPVAASRRRPRAGVGRQVGRELARSHAKGLRRGASRDPLDALDPGQARRLHGDGLRVRLVRARVGPVDGAVVPLPEHAVQLVVLHGRLAVRADAVRVPRARVAVASWTAPAG